MSILQNGWNIDLLDAYATASFNLPLDEIHKIKKNLGIALLIIQKDATISLLNHDILNLKSITF